jgi:hypothetical protein
MVCLLWISLAALAGCGPDTSELKVTYGPWEPLHQGRVPDVPACTVERVLKEGSGPRVEPGTMVEVRLVTTFGERQVNIATKDKVQDLGRYWIYVAFDSDQLPDRQGAQVRTADQAAARIFGAGNGHLPVSLIGLSAGEQFTFQPCPSDIDSGGSIIGGAGAIPFGDFERYVAMQPLARGSGALIFAKTAKLDNESSIEILRVCKGRAAQRLVTLLDSTEISVGQDLGRTFKTSEPRWNFLREARWSGVCNDGKSMHFDYGPVGVDPPEGAIRGLGLSRLFGPWSKNAWNKIETGVSPGE